MLPDRKELIDALDALADDSDGTLSPADVVEAAAPPTSPLHRYFDWDDAHAAHEHRLFQARHLLRVTVLVRQGSATLHLPIFTSLSTERVRGGESYRRTGEVRAGQPWLYGQHRCLDAVRTSSGEGELGHVFRHLALVALALAQMEVGETRRVAPAEEARVGFVRPNAAGGASQGMVRRPPGA